MKETLLELEDFIYKFYGEGNEEISIAVLATILGVFAGIKPAGILTNDVMGDGRILLSGGELINFLSRLGIYILVGPNNITGSANMDVDAGVGVDMDMDMDTDTDMDMYADMDADMHELAIDEMVIDELEPNEEYTKSLDAEAAEIEKLNIDGLDVGEHGILRFGLDGYEIYKFNLMSLGKYKGGEFLYISFQKKLCLELKQAYERMVELSRDGSSIDGEEDEWTAVTIQIGALLGYPETAIIEYTAKDKNELYISSEEYQARIRRNRYYIHSEIFENEEFKEYDLPMNLAIKKYLPHTTALMEADKAKRWLG